jgi:hypothetical protein
VTPEEAEHLDAWFAVAFHLFLSPDTNLQYPLQFFTGLIPFGRIA